MSKKRTKRVVLAEINELESFQKVCLDPRVLELVRKIRKENAPKIKLLKDELNKIVKSERKKKPRWPEGTPDHVMEVCEGYWRGTEEYTKFRIHCWNDFGVWTSYPSGGYSDNGGWHPCPACFYLLDLKTMNENSWRRNRVIESLEGRVSMKKMQERLDLLKD